MIVLLEIAVSKTVNEYSYKAWYMTENANKIKILLLGNSLFANSINPHVFGDSVFDGAITGRTFFYDVQIVKKYVPRMNNLQVVLIPIHIDLPVKPQQELFYRFRYARYMGIPLGKNPLQYSALFSGYLNYCHFISEPIYHCVEKTDRSNRYIDSLGYQPLFHVWNGRSRNTCSLTFSETFISCRDIYVRQVTEMAEICNSIGVRLICILPPLSNHYLEKIEPVRFDTLNSTMQNLCNTLNIEYRFYHNDVAFRSDSLFFDESHLNHIGATLFALRVKEDFNL